MLALLAVLAPAAVAQTTAAGAVPGSFSVGPNGDAQYVIPLQVPPGINGNQPQLSLGYSSHGGNDLPGVGWNLAGGSAITRCKATPAFDGRWGAIGFDSGDRYCLDGARLLNTSGTYGAGGSVYRTNLETWRIVTASAATCGSGPCSFSLAARDGSTWSYGTSADSVALAAGKPDVRTWAIKSVADALGNTATFSYTTNPLALKPAPPDNEIYLQRIDYTSNGAFPANRSIVFRYESRADVSTRYVGGTPVTTRARLAGISTAVAGRPVLDYRLDYTPSAVSGRSLLRHAKICSGTDAGAACMTPTAFDWQGSDRLTFTTAPLAAKLSATATQRLPLDVNGDGRADLVTTNSGGGSLQAIVYQSTGNDLAQCSGSPVMLPATPLPILGADVNGDGRGDLIVRVAAGGQETVTAYVAAPGGCAFTASGPATVAAGARYVWPMDVNADGRGDLLYGSSNGQMVTLQPVISGSGGFTPGTSSQVGLATNARFFPSDVNGDGMVDLVQAWSNGGRLSFSASLASYGNGGAIVYGSAINSTTTGALTGQLLQVDVNADGNGDVVQAWLDGSSILHLTTWIADGTGHFVTGTDVPTRGTTGALALWPFDITGDHSSDLVQAWSDERNVVHLLVFRPAQNGLGLGYDGGTDTGTSLSSTDFAQTWPLDLNGDGVVDLLQAANVGGALSLTLFSNSGPASDLIAGITDGMQGQTAVTYLPMSSPTVYGANASTYPRGPAMAYAYRQAPALAPFQMLGGGTMQLVATWTARSSVSNPPYSYPHSMKYAGGAIDYTGFGWLGFQTRSETDLSSGRITTSVYNQTYPLIGTPATVTTSCIAVPGGDPLCPATTPATLVVSTTQYTTTRTATSSSAQQTPVWLSAPGSTRMDRYVYGTYDYSLGKSYAYDAYGNATLVSDLGYVDRNGNNASPSDDVFTCSSYLNQTTPLWLLGNETGQKTSSTSACTDFGTFDPKNDFSLWRAAYGPTGLRSSLGTWDSSNSVWLEAAYTYDAYGNMLTQVDPGNRTTTYTYDATFHTYLQTETSPPDAAGVQLTTTYGYDPRFGVAVASTDPNQLTRVRCIDGFGRLQATQVPVPSFVAMQPDTNCVPDAVTGPASQFRGAQVVTTETQTNARDGAGNLYLEVQSLENFSAGTARSWSWTRSYFDGLGRTSQTVDQGAAGGSGNVSTCSSFDSADSVLAQSLPSFISGVSVSCSRPQNDSRFWIASTYDALSRMTRSVRPAGPDGKQTSTTTIAYGSHEAQTVTSAAGDAYALTKTYNFSFFNGDRKTVSMVFNTDGNATTTFGYDRIGRMTTAVDPPTAANPKGVTNTIAYDSLSRRTCVANPDQAPGGGNAVCWAYDPVTAFLKSSTDATGRVSTYAFDALGRKIRQVDPDGTTAVYTYDDPNVPFSKFYLTAVDVTGPAPGRAPQYRYALTYDNLGNMASRTLTLGSGPGPYTTRRQTDPRQRIAQVTYPDGSVLQNTFVNGYLTATTVGGSAVASYSAFDPYGSAQSIRYGNGVQTARSFAPTSEETGVAVTDASRTKLLDRTFNWNHLGFVTAAVDNLRSGIDFTQNYAYTGGRLTGATSAGLYGSVAYGYDASGNLTRINDTAYAYSAHRVVSATKDQATVLTAAYDGNGNLKSKVNGASNWGYTYDSVNRLTAVSLNSSTVLQAPLYDDSGARLLRQDGDAVMSIYADPLYVVTDSPGNYVLGTRYVPGPDGVIAALTTLISGTAPPGGGGGLPGVGPLYLHADVLGTTLLTTNAQGALSSQIAYMPVGAPVAKGMSGPDDYRLKFTGKELDEPTGLYYFNARYYDPSLGRFISPDTRLGSDLYAVDALNRFAFALNNPTSFVDPTGHSALDRVLGALVGTVEIAAGVALDVVTDGALAPVSNALIGAGVNGITYSITTSNNNFSWRSYGIQTGIGAAMGLVMGGFGGGAAGEEAGLVEASEAMSESELAAGSAQAESEFAIDAAGSEATTEAEAAESQASESAAGDEETAAQGRNADEESSGQDDEQCQASPSSMAEGTEIASETGMVPVETLAVGQKVWGFDAATRTRGLFEVVAATATVSPATIRITLGTRHLDATPDQVLWVGGKGWTAARNIAAGDTLADASGRFATVDCVEQLRGQRAFHEFEVAEAHTFFASDDAILAHNPGFLRRLCMGGTPGKMSRTGREVLDRMKKDNLVRVRNGETEVWSKVSDTKSQWVKFKDTDMAHIKDAVKYWNETGWKTGLKSPAVRRFMLDSENYMLQYGRYNRSLGARLGIVYRAPKGWTGLWPPI
jgi:RHS repeat-associated protein